MNRIINYQNKSREEKQKMISTYIDNLEISKNHNKLKIEHYHFRKSFLTDLLTFNEEYNLPFPEGKWVEALNTEDTKYGGCGRYSNVGNVFSCSGLSDDDVKTPIKLGRTSTIYFKKIA